MTLIKDQEKPQELAGRSLGDAERQSIGSEDLPTKSTSAFKALSFLDRFLALWIFLAMALGIVLGATVPETGKALQQGQFVGVSVPIGKSSMTDRRLETNQNTAVGLLIMMYPILCKVRYESLHELLSHRAMWKQICFSVFINWFIAPFLMVSPSHSIMAMKTDKNQLGLAWAFLPDKAGLRTGLILVGLGRCIAMVRFED